jgi:hypothetical protein
MTDVVIIDAIRTPIGRYRGALSPYEQIISELMY